MTELVICMAIFLFGSYLVGSIPFGMIIWGGNGDADALYFEDAMRLVTLIGEAFPDWESMPSHLIFQSWAQSRTGLRITPDNLPEWQANTHTNLINHALRILRGPVERQPRPGSVR